MLLESKPSVRNIMMLGICLLYPEIPKQRAQINILWFLTEGMNRKTGIKCVF